MDPLDLADPIRLLILLLPEPYRAPAAVILSALVASQLIAASIIARLPLSAREHPRWGRVVRALHWYSLLRLRDEAGTTKPIGADVAPRVTLAPTRADEVVLDRPTVAPPAPISALRATTLTGREGERGSASVRSLLALAVGLTVVLPLGFALCGCPSVIREPSIEPPPAPADAGTTACHNGAPWRFTAGEWSQADRQCNRLSTDASAVVCCATPSAMTGASIHACVPMSACSPEVSR
ncbi:MAG: hypothetical protein Q8S73_37010 [Deltaproteobacteria bacterium]|nr:hypothetical protein [Myxococcales bacterium]MDP3219761.1 hypothetical protein [Deltaproteobacteria bacterium]